MIYYSKMQLVVRGSSLSTNMKPEKLGSDEKIYIYIYPQRLQVDAGMVKRLKQLKQTKRLEGFWCELRRVRHAAVHDAMQVEFSA